MLNNKDSRANFATRWQARLTHTPLWLLALGIYLFAFIKGGLRALPIEADPLSTFPTPQPTLTALSYGSRTLAWAFRWDSPQSYIWISAIIALAVAAVLPWLSSKRLGNADGRIMLIVIALGPIGLSLLSNIGRHDSWVLAGGLLIGLCGQRLTWALAGTFLMLLGNPEQALVATACVFILSFAQEFRPRLRPAAWSLALAVLTFGALAFWAQLAHSGTRLGYLRQLLGDSTYNFYANFSLSLYGALGISWIAVLFLLYKSRNRDRVLIALSVLIIPFLVTATTLDQTRVFVGISSAAVVTLSGVALPQMRQMAMASGHQNVLFWALALALLLPAVVVNETGSVNVSQLWFFTEVVPHIRALIVRG